jgi:hypothetical protein
MALPNRYSGVFARLCSFYFAVLRGTTFRSKGLRGEMLSGCTDCLSEIVFGRDVVTVENGTGTAEEQ